MTTLQIFNFDLLRSRLPTGLAFGGVGPITWEMNKALRAAWLAMHRAYHAKAFSSASPLALDLLAHHGIDVDGAAALPETVKASLAGRPLDAVFDIPVPCGRGYLVREVVDRAGAGVVARRRWSLLARVPRVAWRVPWPRAGFEGTLTGLIMQGHCARRGGFPGGMAGMYVCRRSAGRGRSKGSSDAEA